MKQPGEMGLLMVRSQSEPWEMLTPEAKKGHYSGESGPTTTEGATSCLGGTLLPRPHSIKTQKTL